MTFRYVQDLDWFRGSGSTRQIAALSERQEPAPIFSIAHPSISSPMAESPPEPTTVFRPLKRRKVFRQRDSSQSPSRDDTATPDSDANGPPSEDNPVANASVAEQLRQRKALQRRGGITFSAAQTDTPCGEASAEPQRISKDAPTDDYAIRFAPQTGQVADVNKHMLVSTQSTPAIPNQFCLSSLPHPGADFSHR